MDKNRGNEAPPLASGDFRIGLHTEGPQCRFIRAAAGQRHQEEDGDVKTEKNISEYRAATPDRLEKFQMVFRNHVCGCRCHPPLSCKSCCNLRAISLAAWRALSS